MNDASSLNPFYLDRGSEHLAKTVARFYEFHKHTCRCEHCHQNTDYCPQQAIDRGQHPERLEIICCDSRSNPSATAAATGGEVFTSAVIANLVPPLPGAGPVLHGTQTWASIFYAAENLKVPYIEVQGHSKCGGMAALFNNQSRIAELEARPDLSLGAEERIIFTHLIPGLPLIGEARARFERHNGRTPDQAEMAVALERENVIASVRNIRHYLNSRFAGDPATQPELRGTYFDITRGNILLLNEESGRFEPLTLFPQRNDVGNRPDACPEHSHSRFSPHPELKQHWGSPMLKVAGLNHRPHEMALGRTPCVA